SCRIRRRLRGRMVRDMGRARRPADHCSLANGRWIRSPPGAGVGQRRQPRGDLLAGRLQPGREDEPAPELLDRAVDGEAGFLGGELEQHAARLSEVDRVEVVAVDDARVLYPG